MPRVWPSLVLLPVLAACSSNPATGAGGAGGQGGAASSSEGSAPGSGSGAQASSGSGATGSTSTSGSGSSSSGPASSSGSGASSSSSGGMGSACAHPFPEYTSNNGSVTYYTFSMGSPTVNCSYAVAGQNPDVVAHVATGGGKYFGAMNTADYNNAATCGACVEVTRDNAKKVVLTIVDQCPSNGNPVCKAGHIDLSEQAFLQIGTQAEGYLGTGNGGAKGLISWKYVPCPVNEDVSFVLKDPANMFWNQILVQGHKYAINKLEVLVGGQWVAGTREAYNYWQVGNGDMGPPPYQVRVTDINGDVIQAQLNLMGGEQLAGAQFPVCQ